MTNPQVLSELTNLWLDPLSEEELGRLSEYFDDLHDEMDSMNLSMIDGFFTALVLSPNPQLPDDWLAQVVEDLDTFSHLPDHAEMVDFLFRHYQEIKFSLTAVDPPEFSPMFLYHEDHEQPWVADWCYGFIQGVQCDLAIWAEMSDVFPLLELITAISTLPPPAEPLLVWEDSLSEEDKLFYETQQMAIRALDEYHRVVDPIAGWDAFLELLVLSIHDFVLNPSSEADEVHTPSVLGSAHEIEILCPCGSGKGFAVCCGASNRLIH